MLQVRKIRMQNNALDTDPKIGWQPVRTIKHRVYLDIASPVAEFKVVPEVLAQ